ncbi:site-specific integrase [Methylotuvimicrobium sp. KM2]|uniref:tyrosine-type recombinase/integrase n=1 Tax=Methylotuvimicrobium sp. KM2 TaxID=3133976 RepID=UPI0031013F7E
MATIKERIGKDGKPKYTAEIRLKGHPRETATFARLTDCKKWIASTESAIRENRYFPAAAAKKNTLTDAITRYLCSVTQTKHFKEHQSVHLKRWADELGYLPLSEVTPGKITEVKDKLLNEITAKGTKRSPATVNRYLSSLSPVLTSAANEWGWLDDSPMRKVKKGKESRGRVRFLDDVERKRLLDACQVNDWLYLAVIVSLSTGMRKGELMGLQWQDVNLKEGFIILHETKNGERRRVPITGLALELLRGHSKVRRLDSQLLFPGVVSPNKPFDLRKAWQAALKRAEIEDFRWHDLRHCTASYLVMNGASLAEIAEILGHKTLAMVKRYSHLSDGHVSGVVASMNDKIFGNGSV